MKEQRLLTKKKFVQFPKKEAKGGGILDGQGRRSNRSWGSD